MRAIPFQEGGIEPNQLGSDPREPMNSNNNKRNSNKKSNRNHSDVSDEVSNGSDPTHTMPSSMNLDEFNASQDSQEKEELIMEKQIQKLETSNKQERPTEATKSDMQQILINIDDQATLIDQPRRDLSPWEDVEGTIGISLHGPCCHGPRVFLTVTGDAQKTRAKVDQSTVRR